MKSAILQQYEIMLVIVLVLMTMVAPDMDVTKAAAAGSKQSYNNVVNVTCTAELHIGDIEIKTAEKAVELAKAKLAEKIILQMAETCPVQVFKKLTGLAQSEGIAVSVR